MPDRHTRLNSVEFPLGSVLRHAVRTADASLLSPAADPLRGVECTAPAVRPRRLDRRTVAPRSLLRAPQLDVGPDPACQDRRRVPDFTRFFRPHAGDAFEQRQHGGSHRAGDGLRADRLGTGCRGSPDQPDVNDRVRGREIRKPGRASRVYVLGQYQHGAGPHGRGTGSIRCRLPKPLVQPVVPNAAAGTNQVIQLRAAAGDGLPLPCQDRGAFALAVRDVIESPGTLRLRMAGSKHLGCQAALVTVPCGCRRLISLTAQRKRGQEQGHETGSTPMQPFHGSVTRSRCGRLMCQHFAELVLQGAVPIAVARGNPPWIASLPVDRHGRSTSR